jgi:hypothetical protein
MLPDERNSPLRDNARSIVTEWIVVTAALP